MPPFQKRTHRARETLRAFEMRYPGLFDRADAIRGDGAPPWPKWCYMPAGLLQSMVDPLDAPIASALLAWRMTQGIYRFDDADRLAATSVDSLPADLFAGLPEWCVYIESPRPTGDLSSSGRPAWTFRGLPVTGFWLHLDAADDDGDAYDRICLLFDVARRPKDLSALQAFSVPMIAGQTLADALTPNNADVAPFLAVAARLCAPDVTYRNGTGNRAPSIPRPVRTRDGWRVFAASGLSVWRVESCG
jgi:hypothetical protein